MKTSDKHCFQVGDRVVSINIDDRPFGYVGTILLKMSGNFLVKFDDFKEGHRGLFEGKTYSENKDCWWVFGSSEIELEEIYNSPLYKLMKEEV